MKRGRPRKEVIVDNPKPQYRKVDRFCYSADAIWCGDGQFRWWQEYDDSGYGWDGHFDILTKEQLEMHIDMCRRLGIPVYEKFSDDSYEYRDRIQADENKSRAVLDEEGQ